MRRVVITGIGIVSPVGCGKEVYWDALAAGKNGVRDITLFDTSAHDVKIAAEATDFNPEEWMDKKEVRRSDRVIPFSVAASDMAVKDSGLDMESVDSTRVGVYFGSGAGGIGTTHDNYAAMWAKGPSRISPFFIPMMLCNMPAAYVGIRHKAKGPNIAVVTACASSTNSIAEALYSIRRNETDIILAGGGEAAITPMGIGGFATLKALSTRNDDPAHASRPFDVDRDGFVMGEGAGVLVLEELEHARARGAHIYGELAGCASTCDAYHITAPDPDGDGPLRAMKLAIEQAGWKIEDVDLVNAHGTSTPLNDKMEALAIKNLFGEHAKKLLVHSTKSMIGHLLGAAGAAETIAALLAVERGIVHPTINLEHPDPECFDLNYVPNKAVSAKVDRFLVNNFGFGGHNCVLAIERFKD